MNITQRFKMKKFTLLVVALALSIFLSGCGGTITINKPLDFSKVSGSTRYKVNPISHDKITRPVDEKMLYSINSVVTKKLLNRKRLQTNTSDKPCVVDIEITKYRVKNGFLRFMTGPMSGVEYIDSVVTVKDPKGKIIGEATIHNYNASSFRRLKGSHSKSIIKFLLGKTD